MKIKKVLQRKIRRDEAGVNVAADVNAVVAANVNESKGQRTRVSSHQRWCSATGVRSSPSSASRRVRAGRAVTEPSKRFRPADSEPEGLSAEELEAERGEPLPDREAMSTIDANVAIPINPSVAASVLAGGSADDVEDSEDEEQRGEERAR